MLSTADTIATANINSAGGILVKRTCFLVFILSNFHYSFSQEAFQIRGYDLGRTSGLMSQIESAAENGMNMVTLSHDICMDWFDIDESFEAYAGYAKQLDLDIYFWNHVIERPPAEFVYGSTLLFDDPGLMQWLCKVYNEMMDKVPSMSGVVLSFTEAEWQIHRSSFEPEQGQENISTSLSPDERIRRVILTIYNTLNARGKKLIIRDFWRTNTESWYLWKALQSCPKDIMVYTKHKPNDFRYGYPANSTLGQYPDRMQILEIEIAKPDPEYYKNEYQLAKSLGVNGICPRWRVHSDEFRDLNNACYNVLAHDPDADITDVILKEGYTTNDIVAMSHYMESFRMVNYDWDFYLGKHLKIDESKMEERLHKGEGREIYTDDDLTNLYSRKLRGLEGIEAANELFDLKNAAIDSCIKWADTANSYDLKSLFWELKNFSQEYKPVIKSFVEKMYAENASAGTRKTPLPPDSVELQVISDKQIDISWRDNSDNEKFFKLERKDGEGLMRQIALLDANTTSFSDVNLKPGTEHSYRIRAYASIEDRWNSPYTYTKIATTTGTPVSEGPEIYFTLPVDNNNYFEGSPIIVNSVLNDPDSVIQSIDLLIDNTIECSSTTIPFEWSLDELTPGEYELTLNAYSNSDLITCSDIIQINVIENQTSVAKLANEFPLKVHYDRLSDQIVIENITTTTAVEVYNSMGNLIHRDAVSTDKNFIDASIINESGVVIIRIEGGSTKILL